MAISLKGVNLGYMGIGKSLLVEKPENENVQYPMRLSCSGAMRTPGRRFISLVSAGWNLNLQPVRLRWTGRCLLRIRQTRIMPIPFGIG